jgi:hypothetical protein
MKIEAIPAAFVKIESGKHEGPPLVIDTEAKKPDTIVISLRDFVLLAQRDGGKEENPVLKYALNFRDARFLLMGMLKRLSEAGDEIASELFNKAHQLIEEKKE